MNADRPRRLVIAPPAPRKQMALIPDGVKPVSPEPIGPGFKSPSGRAGRSSRCWVLSKDQRWDAPDQEAWRDFVKEFAVSHPGQRPSARQFVRWRKDKRKKWKAQQRALAAAAVDQAVA